MHPSAHATRSFSDTEDLSNALKHANVPAMQVSKGAFSATLSQMHFRDWSLQFIEFFEGASVCAGDAPSDNHAFVLPLRYTPHCRLLGEALTDDTLGVYAPNSEHADATFGGCREVVIVPPKGIMCELSETEQALRLPTCGSTLRRASVRGLAQLRDVLYRIPQSYGERGQALDYESTQRSLSDAIACALDESLRPNLSETNGNLGRPKMPRSAILRRIEDILHTRRDSPVFAGELAREVGISQPSLQRVFAEWFGMPPARYLSLKRFYMARQMLRTGSAASVTDAACTLGFWDFSRFSRNYKLLFGELPSETLHGEKVKSGGMKDPA